MATNPPSSETLNTGHKASGAQDAPDDFIDVEVSEHQTALFDHLTELRLRLLYMVFFLVCGMVAVYPFAEDLLAFLSDPLTRRLPAERPLIYTGLSEAFLMRLKLSFYGGLMVSFPFLLFQAWRFIKPALKTAEKSVFWIFAGGAPLLFLGGLVMAYTIVFPLAWEFFLSFESAQMQLLPKVSEYVSLVLKMMVAFGVLFQLPIILIMLGVLNLVEVATLKKGRKYALVGILAVAAIVTPPDIISQILLTIPVYALYESALILLTVLNKGSKNA